MSTTADPGRLQAPRLFPSVDVEPYKGLMPYSAEDATFFFGRQRERDIIIGNLLARRLLLLYGASGVGKSSVLGAGVVYSLRQTAQQNLRDTGSPEFAVAVMDSWRDDPVAELKARVLEGVRKALGPHADVISLPAGTLSEFLKAAAEQVGGDLFLIFDQFEEYFLYHRQDEGEGSFATQLPRIINDPHLPVNILVSMREDALAKLDRFKGSIPNLFENYLRIDHLDRVAATEAIVKPIERYNGLYADQESRIEIEPEVVEVVLNDVEINQIDLTETGRAGVKANGGAGRIETPYLQLVMTRLWKEEMAEGSRVLRLKTLQVSLGGAEHIVRTHLDSTMKTLTPEQQAVASQIFRYLVTPSETKYAYSIVNLAYHTALPAETIAPVVHRLADRDVRILRDIGPPADPKKSRERERYQIFHDVLGSAILDWRRRYVEQQEQDDIRREEERLRQQELEEAERRRTMERQRLLRRGGIGAAILGFTILISIGWALGSRRQSISAKEALIGAEFRFANNMVTEEGLVSYGDTLFGELGSGASYSSPLFLRGRGDFLILARCDGDCGNLNLRLFSGEKLVAADTSENNGPMLLLETPADSVYRLMVEMAECSARSCYFGYKVYHLSPEAAVARQLATVTKNSQKKGYELEGDVVAGLITKEGRREQTVRMASGAEYMIVGVCDQYCHDLDLRLFDGTRLIASDTLPDAQPRLIVSPEVTGSYQVRVEMANCSSGACDFAYQVYRSDPQIRGRHELRARLEGPITDEMTVGRYREVSGQPEIGLLDLGANTSSTRVLQANATYTVATICSEGCLVNLSVHSGGREVPMEGDPDGIYHVFTAPADGEYRFTLQMKRCAGGTCGYGYQLYRDLK